MSGVFDPGLQPERTQLAWRRTALSVAVGSIVSLRILPALLGSPGWYVPGIVGVAVAAWMWWVAHRRYLGFHEQLGDGRGEPRHPGGMALFAVALFAAVIGVLALFVALAGRTLTP